MAPRCLVLCFCLVDALCTNRSMYEYGKGLQQMGLYGSMMHLGWWCNWGCRGAFGMLVGFISQLLMWRLPSGFIQVASPLHSQGWVSPSHFSQPRCSAGPSPCSCSVPGKDQEGQQEQCLPKDRGAGCAAALLRCCH